MTMTPLNMINFGRRKDDLKILFVSMVLDKHGSDFSSYQNSSKVMVMVKGRMSYCKRHGQDLG